MSRKKKSTLKIAINKGIIGKMIINLCWNEKWTTNLGQNFSSKWTTKQGRREYMLLKKISYLKKYHP